MHLTKESELPEKYDDVIKPWFDSEVDTGFWKLGDGVSIFYAYAHHESAKSVIVISSGRVECAAKYAELMYDLFESGHSVFIHDHRGQGLSSRTTKNPHHGYIRDFSQYVADFQHMIDDVLIPMVNNKLQGKTVEAAGAGEAGAGEAGADAILLKNTYPPLHLLCHSMGSAVGAMLVQARPELFSKAIYCSPMFGITPPLPPWMASILVFIGVSFNKLRGVSASYFLGQGDYSPTAFYKNRLMSSEVRYRIFRQTYAQQPQLQLGGVTYEWLNASLQAMDKIRQHARELTVPCMVIYSGADTVVANSDIEDVINELPICQSTCIPEALHELFFEKDKFRIPALTQILDFFAEP